MLLTVGRRRRQPGPRRQPVTATSCHLGRHRRPHAHPIPPPIIRRSASIAWRRRLLPPRRPAPCRASA